MEVLSESHVELGGAGKIAIAETNLLDLQGVEVGDGVNDQVHSAASRINNHESASLYQHTCSCWPIAH